MLYIIYINISNMQSGLFSHFIKLFSKLESPSQITGNKKAADLSRSAALHCSNVSLIFSICLYNTDASEAHLS